VTHHVKRFTHIEKRTFVLHVKKTTTFYGIKHIRKRLVRGQTVALDTMLLDQC